MKRLWAKLRPLHVAVVLLTMLGIAARSAGAQLGVYVMGSGGRLSGTNVGYGTAIGASGSFTAYGGTAGVYDNFLRLGPVKLGSDLRGFLQHSSNASTAGNDLRGLLVGLRLTASAPLLPVKPYVQAEIGGASTNYGVNTSRTGNFAYQVQVGGDFTVFPHLDIRAEYGAGELHSVFGGSNNQTMQQFGAGAVLRF